MKIILLGAPGAGKGTQAEILGNLLGIPQISTGNILRTIKHSDSPFATEVKNCIDDGRFVSDDLIIRLLCDRLSQTDCERGYIIDGAPRTMPQAEMMEQIGIGIDYAIAIEVCEQTVIDRLSGRRTCKVCGSCYHVTEKPPKAEGICDNCGSELTVRHDDTPETIAKRLKIYHDETEPLKAFYEAKGKLRTVDSRATIEETTGAIMAALGI